MVLLTLKMFGVSLYTGLKRRASHTPANPEDRSLVLRGHDHPTADPQDVERGLGLHRNDMENIYLYMFISIVFPLSFNPELVIPFAPVFPDYFPDAWASFNLIFLISRYMYSLCYIFGLQPWRSICFWVGQAITIIFAIWSLVVVL